MMNGSKYIIYVKIAWGDRIPLKNIYERKTLIFLMSNLEVSGPLYVLKPIKKISKMNVVQKV